MEGTKPIPDAHPMLVGDEFLDADEAHRLLYGVYSALCSAGWLRCDIRPAPVKIEADVIDRLKRAIVLLTQFTEEGDEVRRLADLLKPRDWGKYLFERVKQGLDDRARKAHAGSRKPGNTPTDDQTGGKLGAAPPVEEQTGGKRTRFRRREPL